MTTEQKQVAALEWALLWSHSQCAMHIEPVMDMLKQNRQACATDRGMDYVPIAIGSREECDAAASRLRPYLNERRAGAISH
ncbi:hypothetical protein GY14_20775 [Delftia tsuruhatensis]|nr:hypothetical protein GY14_20775 [Delftia tsuruhatensis]